MVTMTINFNKNKLREQGYTEEQVLEPFDEYCFANGVSRPKINVFEKDGKHALALIGKIMYQIMNDENIICLLESWYWDVDGEREDLLKGAYKWNKKR